MWLAQQIKDDPWRFIQDTIYCLNECDKRINVEVPGIESLDIPINLRNVYELPNKEGLWWVQTSSGYKAIVEVQRDRASKKLTILLDEHQGLWVSPDIWKAAFAEAHSYHYTSILTCTPMIEESPF
jgi:predicted helicase